MLRESRNDSRLYLSFAALFAGVAACPWLTLFNGQVIKQFESYSLAQSMAAVGWNPFGTTIPCDGGIRWVLELPLFVGLGGVFVKLFPEVPSVLPLLVYGLFLFALARLRVRLAPRSSPLVWIAVGAAPVFLRFSTQFLADPLALALLLLGAGLFLDRRRFGAAFAFLLAVSVKPTVLPSILFFRWAFAPERGPRDLMPKPAAKWIAREAAFAAVFVAPFAAWSLAVKVLGIPSPMHQGGLLAVGSDWGILADPKFYSKFLVWTVFQGVGIPLAVAAIFGGVRAWRERELDADGERLLRLAAWSVGIFPYWLLVRRLNFIHDYYSLSFFLPIALLGAFAVEREGARRPVVKWLFALTILHGVGAFVASAAAPHAGRDVAHRPVFCGKEFRPESLMGLPPAAPGSDATAPSR